MRGRELLIGLAGLVALAAAPAMAVASQAVVAGKSKTFSASPEDSAAAAKTISKKKLKVNTKSTAVSFGSGTTVGAQAACTGKTHLTGGGFAVAPGFNAGTGLRSLNPISHPVDTKTWNAGGSAFTAPAASGSFTTFARCEGNALGKLVTTLTGATTIPPDFGQVMNFVCAPGTHVISGGYSGTLPNNLNSPGLGTRIIVLQNQRTGTGQWTVAGFNNMGGGVTAALTGYATCEADGKRRTVTEASAVAPIGDNVRSAADATCTGKKHVVSGGFLLSPAVFPGPALYASVDESNPVDKKGWHVGLYEYPEVGLPPGSNVATYAYCKKDPPKQKK
jgi:hypothetical protein